MPIKKTEKLSMFEQTSWRKHVCMNVNVIAKEFKEKAIQKTTTLLKHPTFY